MEKLYMPANISTENTIFNGIGGKELKYLLNMAVCSIVIGLVTNYITGTHVGILVGSVLVMASYFLVVKNPNDNSSTIKGIINGIRFFKNQKVYNFKYTEWYTEWGEIYEKEEN